MREAVETALHALTLWRGHNADAPPALGLIDSTLVRTNLLPTGTLSLVACLRKDQPEWDKAQANNLLTQSDRLLSQTASVLESAHGS